MFIVTQRQLVSADASTFVDQAAILLQACFAGVRMSRWIVCGSLVLLVGCSSTLEDGYKPRKLGASDAARRSYYASPFTPEANVSKTDREQELEARRPRPGY